MSNSSGRTVCVLKHKKLFLSSIKLDNIIPEPLGLGRITVVPFSVVSSWNKITVFSINSGGGVSKIIV